MASFMTGDAGNALIETVGGLLIWNHVRAILRDKEVKGVSLAPLAFFTVWGYWNLWFYPSVGQWLSGVAAIMPAIANTVWIVLLVRYLKPSPIARWPPWRRHFGGASA